MDGSDVPRLPASRGRKRSRSAQRCDTTNSKRLSAAAPNRSKSSQSSRGRGKAKRGRPSHSVPRVESDVICHTAGAQNDEGDSWSLVSSISHSTCQSVQMSWQIDEVLAEQQQLDRRVAGNVIKLIDEDKTIPFIVRYRKDMVDNMEPEKLRSVFQNYKNLRELQKEASARINKVESQGKMTAELRQAFRAAKTKAEVDHLFEPYKTSGKRTLAERARKLGLDLPATKLLLGHGQVFAESLVDVNVAGLETPQKVLDGIQHIIADIISKDTEVLSLIRQLCLDGRIMIQSTPSRTASQQMKAGDNNVLNKYKTYADFSFSAQRIKPYQVLALDRGEKEKLLSVKVDVPDFLQELYQSFCRRHWLNRQGSVNYPLRVTMMNKAIDDSFKRLVRPLMERQIRARLTEVAQQAGVKVFSDNLKNKLLTPPVRGESVLGIDPGFRHGCKLGLVSATGFVLWTGAVFPQFGRCDEASAASRTVVDIIKRHSCELIAIGNGTAHRETEAFIADLIRKRLFAPLNVHYVIVDEGGTSVYSCSEEAKKEFPQLDEKFISALSIARRLQDPMSEYVKVDPKSLGVGMYQHDLKDSILRDTLESVVVECVSFVGVDLNVASEMILRKIAGLDNKKAKNIVNWRESNGCFTNRQQLFLVSGLGEKTFEQCAGFVRVLPETCKAANIATSSVTVEGDKKRSKKRKIEKVNSEPNHLDRTWIHPESYHIADKMLSMMKVDPEHIGERYFITCVESFVKSHPTLSLSEELGVSLATIELIVGGLTQPRGYDIRSQMALPIFRKSLTRLEDLTQGMTLTGVVRNVVDFGAFVDVGVGQDGLIHISKGGGRVQLNDKVEVTVNRVDVGAARIGLSLTRVL